MDGHRERVAAAVMAQAEAWMRGDPDGVAAGFADPCEFVVSSTVLRSPGQVRDAVADHLRQRRDIRIEVVRVIVEEDWGAAEWRFSDRDPATGEAYCAEDAVTLRLGPHGIVYWREYADEGSAWARACREAAS